ncbi:MAG: hypothetical protein FJ304_11950 [Planctomycetes bacterium]|nr:hypothetical protein [Planctomycetota bacterium]
MLPLSRFGPAVLILSASALVAPFGRADDPKPERPDGPTYVSPDRKLNLSVQASGEMVVWTVTIRREAFTTPDGGVGVKEVADFKKVYGRGGAKEKYLTALFVPGKSDKTTIVAVSQTSIYAIDAPTGNLLWRVLHMTEAKKADLAFKGEELKVTLDGTARRYDLKTGKVFAE